MECKIIYGDVHNDEPAIQVKINNLTLTLRDFNSDLIQNWEKLLIQMKNNGKYGFGNGGDSYWYMSTSEGILEIYFIISERGDTTLTLSYPNKDVIPVIEKIVELIPILKEKQMIYKTSVL